jgi:capsule biosynthesis phosphatase
LKKIVVDLDGTITILSDKKYSDVSPNLGVVAKLREYRDNGFSIVINTARNMRTYEGNIGKINIYTLPIIIEWLDKHDIPYDEILVGKPWCGNEGFYVDDRAVRPSEFAAMSFKEVTELLAKEKQCS